MTKDEVLRLALEALKEDRAWLETDAPTEVWEKNNEAITAIESTLEANEFNPDWDTQAVLVEEIQRMAKRIEELEAQTRSGDKDEPIGNLEIVDLGDGNKHFDNHWLSDLYSLPCGDYLLYTAKPNQEAKDKPMHPEIKKLYEGYFDKCFRESSSLDKCFRDSFSPQRTWVGLTHAEIDYQAKKDDHGVYFALGALWAEAKLKDKNYD